MGYSSQGFSCNHGIAKAGCLVMCLCVDERLAKVDGSGIVQPAAQDTMEIASTGGVGFDNSCDNEGPSELLGAGHHFDDVTEALFMAFTRRRLGNEILPCEKLRASAGSQRWFPVTGTANVAG